MFHSFRASCAAALSSAGLAPSLQPGQLLPDAFVVAGDWLATATAGSTAPWLWRPADEALRSALLPVQQQFLCCTLSVLPGPAGGACAAARAVDAAEGGGEGYMLVEAQGGAAALTAAAAPMQLHLSLCYDFWWRVPRLYISSTALSPTAILTHFIEADQGGSTATLEAHPLTQALGGLCVSLHPCKHALAMAGLLEGKPPHLYLGILLKVLTNSCPLVSLDTLAT